MKLVLGKAFYSASTFQIAKPIKWGGVLKEITCLLHLMEVRNTAHHPAPIVGSGNGGRVWYPDSKIIIYWIDAEHIYFLKVYPVGLRLKIIKAEVLSDWSYH